MGRGDEQLPAYILGQVVEEVEKIEETIKKLEFAMRHARPVTVDAIRRQKEQLETLYNHIMEQEVLSLFNLEELLSGHRQCLSECINQAITYRTDYIIRSRDYS